MTLHKVACTICGHLITPAAARYDGTRGWVCKNTQKCKAHRR
jgi:hypothetical protein